MSSNEFDKYILHLPFVVIFLLLVYVFILQFEFFSIFIVLIVLYIRCIRKKNKLKRPLKKETIPTWYVKISKVFIFLGM